jgi:hypothetical protein
MNSAKVFSISIAFLFIVNAQAQKGFKYIRKAQLNFEKENYTKVQKYLNKAKKSDYGFCGNAKWDADCAINKTEILLNIKLREFDKALRLLDSSNLFCGNGNAQNDSLKIEVLMLKFGKEKVINAFHKAKNSPVKHVEHYLYTLFIEELGYDFYFTSDIKKVEHNQVLSFKDIAQQMLFYKLLLETL